MAANLKFAQALQYEIESLGARLFCILEFSNYLIFINVNPSIFISN